MFGASSFADRSTFASLRGWTVASPEVVRSPMPWESVALLLDVWLSHAGKFSRIFRQAALVLPWHYDAYLRPREALNIRRSEVFLHAPSIGIPVVIQAGPAAAEGTSHDVAQAHLGRDMQKTDKVDSTMAPLLSPTLFRSTRTEQTWREQHLHD